MKHISRIIAVILLSLPLLSIAQKDDDIFGMLDSLAKPQTDYATATFKSSRVITGQSVEQMKEGQFEFRIEHRFGAVNSGFYQFYGLNTGTIFLSTEYGVKDWMMVGLGHASLGNTFNGFVKLNLMRQSKGIKNNPFTITYYGAMTADGTQADPTVTNYFVDRLGFVNQFLLARKVSNELSLQISPILIHRNIVPAAFDQNNIYSMGFAGRYKITNRMAISAEYYAVYRSKDNSVKYYNPLSVGVDIETGGHVFSFMLTNSVGMLENQYIAQNTGRWSKGDIHLGFNITRSFTFYGKK
jgi:hypothetical protein